MDKDFVNRKNEFIYFNDWINTPTKTNKGIFVYAKSGIGKSRFITEFLNSEASNYIKVKVDIPCAAPSTVGSYYFLMRLYRKIINETERDGKLPLMNRVTKSTNLSLGYIAEVNFSFDFSDKYGYSKQIAKIMTYLNNKLSGSEQYIIDIENFQLVDAESLECFQQLFSTGKNHRFIFEFTMEPNNFTPCFYTVFSKVSTSLDCMLYELKKLKLNEVNILCERKKLPLEIASKLYEKNDGNLFPLVMLEYLPTKTSMHPIHDILNSLEPDQRIILYIIELSCGETHVGEIRDVFIMGKQILAGSKKYNEAYLITQYTALEQKNLVVLNGENIRIVQDQLLEHIATCRNQPDYYLAWSLYENYHQKELSKLSLCDREPHIIALLHVYTIFPDIRIYSILPDLTTIILEQPPEKMIEKICFIRKNLELNDKNRHFNDFLIQYLTDICIAVGRWPMALEQVADYYSEEVPWQACYLAAVIAADPRVPNAEEKIRRMREKHKANIIPYMSMTVSLLSYYLRTVPELKVRPIAKRFLEDFSGNENLNYAFLLKMYANTQDNAEAIRTLEEANKIFFTYHREDLIVMNMITIASRKVYMGCLKEGRDILDGIEERMSSQRIPIRAHYILNNKCAISILEGKIDDQIENDLMTAFYSTELQFEKAIILCNLMIYQIKANKMLAAEKTFQQIQSMQLTQYNNVDLKFILLKNFLFFYSAKKNAEEISKVCSNLFSFALSEDCPEDIRNHIMYILPKTEYPSLQLNGDKPFFAQFPFQADFIGYWQCEVVYDAYGKNRLKEIEFHRETPNS